MRKKIEVLLVIVLMIVLSVNTIAFAATGNAPGSVSLTPSSNSVSNGETFTIEIAQECSDGIIGFESQLNYDTNLLTLQNTALGTEWTNLGEGNKLEAMSNDDQKSGNVFILTFAVKSTEGTTTNIDLSNIKLYKTSTETVDVAQKSTTITLNGGNTTTTDNTSNTNTTNTNTTNTNTNTNTNTTNTTNTIKTTTNNITNTNTNTTTPKTTTNNTKANTTTTASNDTAKTTLPKTGSTTKYILIAVAGLLGIAFVCYKGYIKYKGI